MSNIKVKVNGAKLEMSDVNNAAVYQIIDGFFATQGVLVSKNEPELMINKSCVTDTDKNEQEMVVIKSISKAVENDQPVAVKSVVTKTPTTKDAAATEGEAKTVHLIGQTRTLTAPLADVAKITVKDTNVKPVVSLTENESVRILEDGTPVYKAEFWCPSCGEHGNRFIRETNDYLKCYSCNAHIEVEEAVLGEEELTPDANGVYFVARHSYN